MSDTTARPRILFVTRYHYKRFTGGAEIQCWMLAREFVRRGWDVHYASEMNQVPEPNPLEGVTLHGFPENPFWFTANAGPVRKLLNELQPDVVYSRVYDDYVGLVMTLAPAKTLTVWAAAADGEGDFAAIMRRSRERKSFLKYWLRYPQRKFQNSRKLAGIRAAKLALAQHKDQQPGLARAGVQTVIVRNSLPPVPENEMQTHEGDPTVLWVGSVKKFKRPELFIELARRLADTRATFVIAGDVQEGEYREMITRADRDLKNFHYAGLIPADEIGSWFSKSHIHAKTSLPEGFPNTFVQAWVRGVPVVSLNVDPENLIRDRGLGAAVNSIDEMESALRELIQDPEKRREIGKRAREFAAKEFDLSANVDKLEKLFEERGVHMPTR